MTVKDIADDIAAMLRAGRTDEAGEKYWAADVVSIEATPGDMAEIRGVEGVLAKGEWWTSAHEVHAMEVEGPYLNGDQFAVRMKMDLTVKESGDRITMDEIGLYTVKDGKIAEERFFY